MINKINNRREEIWNETWKFEYFCLFTCRFNFTFHNKSTSFNNVIIVYSYISISILPNCETQNDYPKLKISLQKKIVKIILSGILKKSFQPHTVLG